MKVHESQDESPKLSIHSNSIENYYQSHSQSNNTKINTNSGNFLVRIPRSFKLIEKQQEKAPNGTILRQKISSVLNSKIKKEKHSCKIDTAFKFVTSNRRMNCNMKSESNCKLSIPTIHLTENSFLPEVLFNSTINQNRDIHSFEKIPKFCYNSLLKTTENTLNFCDDVEMPILENTSNKISALKPNLVSKAKTVSQNLLEEFPVISKDFENNNVNTNILNSSVSKPLSFSFCNHSSGNEETDNNMQLNHNKMPIQQDTFAIGEDSKSKFATNSNFSISDTSLNKPSIQDAVKHTSSCLLSNSNHKSNEEALCPKMEIKKCKINILGKKYKQVHSKVENTSININSNHEKASFLKLNKKGINKRSKIKTLSYRKKNSVASSLAVQKKVMNKGSGDEALKSNDILLRSSFRKNLNLLSSKPIIPEKTSKEMNDSKSDQDNLNYDIQQNSPLCSNKFQINISKLNKTNNDDVINQMKSCEIGITSPESVLTTQINEPVPSNTEVKKVCKSNTKKTRTNEINVEVMKSFDFYKDLIIKQSKIHGMGIFTPIEIKKDTLIMEYKGEIIGKCMSDKREKFYRMNNLDSIYMFTVSEDMIIDATMTGNKARYINHSCNPNCQSITSMSDKSIKYCSIRDIKPEEELTINYYMPIDESYDICRCGDELCISKLEKL